MMTMFLSAICALGLNVSVVMAPADTLDKYIINGEKVEKFDGSQLVGKTVSDYKVTVAKGNVSGDVVRIHAIRTDGRKIKDIKSTTSIEGVQVGDKDANTKVTVLSTTAVYVINGKKCDKEALNKIKPEAIASMTVYKPGSKEAVELSGKEDVTVVEVVTKK